MTEVFSSASLLAEFNEAIQELSKQAIGGTSIAGSLRSTSSPHVSYYQRALDLLALQTACVSIVYLDTRQDRISHEFPDDIETAVEKARYLNKDHVLLSAPIPMPDLAQTGTTKAHRKEQGRQVELEIER